MREGEGERGREGGREGKTVCWFGLSYMYIICFTLSLLLSIAKSCTCSDERYSICKRYSACTKR